MKILITGICGFVGSRIAHSLLEQCEAVQIFGVDNLIRPGSERNREPLLAAGVHLIHGDVRLASDFESLPEVDWVIDAAANPSVLAGVDGQTSSRQLVEHNLTGTINLLEYCKRSRAGLLLLSTSRVYSIEPLAELKVDIREAAYFPSEGQELPVGVSAAGVNESFSTQPPLSMYGSTKLASEILALEYGASYGFPVRINRCGVLAGAGQFGRPDQGIFAYWIHSWREARRLRYIGFDGCGHQVRDCLHPDDLTTLLKAQIDAGADREKPSIMNVSGGQASACSLRQISEWCEGRYGAREVGQQTEARPFDLPWVVLDSTLATEAWGWQPQHTRASIFEEIAQYADAHPDWLQISGGA